MGFLFVLWPMKKVIFTCRGLIQWFTPWYKIPLNCPPIPFQIDSQKLSLKTIIYGCVSVALISIQ